MNEEFIPWPDYAVCPNCKEKVQVPKSWRIFSIKPKMDSIVCPNCNTQINYIKPSKIFEPPLSPE
jgi:uncharacterized protein YbaR (Trm112 family)